MNSNKSLLDYYELFYEYADPRIRDYPLMGYPHWVIITFGSYLILAYFILPWYLENKAPYDTLRFAYYVDNVLLVCSLFFTLVGGYAWIFVYNWFCQPIITTTNWEVILCYSYFLTKYIYLIHHLPYVLNKKKSPLMNYLLVHHVSWPIMVWFVINYYPGGHATYPGFINSFAHLMFLGIKFFPSMKQYSRKFHVYVHVVQYGSALIHTIQMFWTNTCGVPMLLIYLEIFGEVSMALIYYISVLFRNLTTAVI